LPGVDPRLKYLCGLSIPQNQAKTENYLSRYGVGPEAFDAFRIAGGAIPHLRLYDRRGNLLKTFSGSDFDHEEVERAVEMQLDPGRDSD